MACNHPGVGDPLGNGNPYADGRPNWNLQTKSRAHGPRDNIGSNWQVKDKLVSPYATDFPDKYKVDLPRQQEKSGMRHFEGHLARTWKERQEGGVKVPEHLASGYLRADRTTGRRALEPFKHDDPKDGGIWNPVAREYPKVAKREVREGVGICAKPNREQRPVDIWPATITVKDPFKPGGLKMFSGKRNTDKNAFPNAMGYTAPVNYDDAGNRIDYSSVEMGGPFGIKKLHKNEALFLPSSRQHAYGGDRRSKSVATAALGESNKAAALLASGPLTGRHGNVFPFLPHLEARDPAAPQRGGRGGEREAGGEGATAGGAATASTAGGGGQGCAGAMTSLETNDMRATTVETNSIASNTIKPSSSAPSAAAYGRRSASGGSRVGHGSRLVEGEERRAPPPSKDLLHLPPSAQGGARHVSKFSPRGKVYHEFPLTHSTKWTFVGGFRP